MGPGNEQLWAVCDGDTDGHSLRTGTFPCAEAPEPAPVVNVTAPRISGTPKVGRTLAGSAGTWTPTPATTTYQWLADGKAIAGAIRTGPHLTGIRGAGGVLAVQPGNVSPTPSKLSYAWYVDGRRIGASGPSLRVLRRWVGEADRGEGDLHAGRLHHGHAQHHRGPGTPLPDSVPPAGRDVPAGGRSP